MGLKPRLSLPCINPFTKVNGNNIQQIKYYHDFIAVCFLPVRSGG
jgi:hypothetical protein